MAKQEKEDRIRSLRRHGKLEAIDVPYTGLDHTVDATAYQQMLNNMYKKIAQDMFKGNDE